MVRFYLDENVTERLADALISLGIDAISANRGHKGLDDATQLLIATDLSRALVTNNTADYLLLHRAWIVWSTAWNLDPVPRHAGIMLIHSASGYDYKRIASEIKAFADDIEAWGEIENRAFAWNATSGWHER